MLSRRSLIVALSASATIPWLGSWKAAAASREVDEAAKFIDALAQQAISVLQNQSGSLEQREQALRKLLSKGFDLPRIGRFVLGRNWRHASAAQRSDYLRLFSEFSARCLNS